jgi:hypothetical protein
MIVKLEGKSVAEALFPCTDWDAAGFRYPNPIPSWRKDRAIACNVTVTGKVPSLYNGGWWLRGRIEWVGDGEPSTFGKCWILCNAMGEIDTTEAA